jgi:hypothetical protein
VIYFRLAVCKIEKNGEDLEDAKDIHE